MAKQRVEKPGFLLGSSKSLLTGLITGRKPNSALQEHSKALALAGMGKPRVRAELKRMRAKSLVSLLANKEKTMAQTNAFYSGFQKNRNALAVQLLKLKYPAGQNPETVRQAGILLKRVRLGLSQARKNYFELKKVIYSLTRTRAMRELPEKDFNRELVKAMRQMHDCDDMAKEIGEENNSLDKVERFLEGLK